MNKNTLKDFFSRFGFVLNIGFGILLLLVYLSVYVPPDRFWLAAFLGLLYPYLFLINPLMRLSENSHLLR